MRTLLLLLPLVFATEFVQAESRFSTEQLSILEPENLVAWCIVPFDKSQRGPIARAKMLQGLGIRRVAYDWRDQHVPTFEQEILAYREHDLEFFAFWGTHDEAFRLFGKYGLHPQIWITAPSPKGESEAERIATAAQALLPLAERTASIGCRLGLYNHGGWGGQPENLVAVCRRLRAAVQSHHVGIVYNFHHAHDRIGDFEKTFGMIRPYLLCLNLNGMNDAAEPKILPIGQGRHEKQMIEIVLESGYTGPVGIIDHRNDLDAQESLKQNLAGLMQFRREWTNQQERP